MNKFNYTKYFELQLKNISKFQAKSPAEKWVKNYNIGYINHKLIEIYKPLQLTLKRARNK